jgi:hypothetical protein
MEVLNNVQLEGRRINVEISKNDGGGRRDHNGRSSGGGGFGGGRSSAPRREGSFAPRREGSGGGRSDRNSGPREGGFGGRSSAPREGGFGGRSSAPRGEGSSDRAPRRSESLVTHLDQEDQEELTFTVNFLVLYKRTIKYSILFYYFKVLNQFMKYFIVLF